MGQSLAARLQGAFERAFLGAGGGSAAAPPPPLPLILLWAAVCLARIPAAFFSLGEDDLWNLVIAVDGGWARAFLFGEPFATNHVLYTLLSKVLIKAAGHHAMEIVYRIPTLVAGALAMPMAYAAGTRLGGPRAGFIASLLFTLAPAFSYHALNARGYMLWSFLALWTVALCARAFTRSGAPAPGLAWRLALAYLLLAASHGLGPLTLGAFLLLGPWLAEAVPEPGGRRRAWVLNLALAVPALLVSARMLWMMAAFKALPDRFEPDYRPVNTWLFPFQWFDANLGSLWLPGLSLPLALILAYGIWVMGRSHPLRAAFLAGLGFGVPFLFAAAQEQGGYARFALGGMAGWVLLIAMGAARLFPGVGGMGKEAGNQAPGTASENRLSPKATAFWMAAALLFWAPNLWTHWTRPLQVDYLGAARDCRLDRPSSPVLFGLSPEFETGLSYYCRRYRLDYRVLNSAAEAEEALKSYPEDFALAWIPQQGDVDPSMPPWVEDRLRLDRVYASGELPLQIWRPKAASQPSR